MNTGGVNSTLGILVFNPAPPAVLALKRPRSHPASLFFSSSLTNHRSLGAIAHRSEHEWVFYFLNEKRRLFLFTLERKDRTEPNRYPMTDS